MASLNLYIVTFNCGLLPIDIDAFASQLFANRASTELPELLVLSLQEIAPLPQAFIGGSLLVPYFNRFHQAVQKSSRSIANTTENDGPVYSPITTRNLGMEGIMVFAKNPSRIRDIENGGVGVGMWEMGHKGAVGVRFTYQLGELSTSLTFVGGHLAPMEWGLLRRNQDWKAIVEGLVFFPHPSNRS